MAKKQQQQEASAAETQSTDSILSDILDRMPATVEKTRGRDLVETLIKGVMSKTVTWDRSLTRTVLQAIDEIDRRMSKQLSAIMHHPEFQKLEGSWRGLDYLVKNTSTGPDLHLKVLNVSKKELHRDLTRALEFDQSALWRRVYEDGFGTAGGNAFGALVGDYEFSNDNMDIELLQGVASVAATAFAPFIAAAAPGLFGLDSFTELPQIRDLATTFDDATLYAKWNSFRNSDDSRFVVLTMPRVLAREPYGSNNRRIDEFKFEEFDLAKDNRTSVEARHDQYTWMNCAYVQATQLTKAFRDTAWCTRIRGFENGGKVEDLPFHVFRTSEGDREQKCPTEILIPDTRENELSKLGFLALCSYKDTDYAVFFGAQTVQKAKKYLGDHAATENAAISARLPYIMASSRIAHYLKCIARDKIGAFTERKELEDFLKRWISAYVLDSAT
ncbi:MAG: type VI secretion system contractile sheath large subunit, partial [Planctomycetaceae bacterium]|nr:type VI secretion system contractile sheath large subunit [Planctomycetaceae bacterium]